MKGVARRHAARTVAITSRRSRIESAKHARTHGPGSARCAILKEPFAVTRAAQEGISSTTPVAQSERD